MVIELRDAGFGYEPGRWLFRHLDLTVEPGEAVAVLGPNGCGKSTLLRCAMGLLRLNEGEARVSGTIGFVPQARQTVFAYTALEMTIMGRARQMGSFGSPGARDIERARAALDRVGLTQLAGRPFFRLSGGEQQLVLIARALATDSRGLVLDEPAAALDLKNQRRVLRLLRDLTAEGIAILLTTHHPDHAQFLARRVVLMCAADDCRIGDVACLLTEAHLSDLYGVRIRAVGYREGEQTGKVLAAIYD